MLENLSSLLISALAFLVLLLFSTYGYGQCTYSGSITSSDVTHSNSLATSAADSSVAVPQTCPGIFTSTGPIHYDQYNFWNSSSATQNYTVTTSAAGCSTFLFSGAYRSSFNPSDLCSGYLASMGSGFSDNATYEFAGESGVGFAVIVEEFDPAVYCASYTVTVTPCATEGNPTASPTPTVVPSVSPTPTPSPATLTVTGRVLTPDARGLRNAVVSMIDSAGNRQFATTSSFGVYMFTGIVLGETYVLSVASKRYRFAPRSVQIFASTTDMDFVGLE